MIKYGFKGHAQIMHKGHTFISCIIDEVADYLITVLIHQCRSEEIGNALIENVISKYCVPDYIIMDQDSAHLCHHFMNYLFKRPDIKIRTVAPYNYQSLAGRTWYNITILTKILI